MRARKHSVVCFSLACLVGAPAGLAGTGGDNCSVATPVAVTAGTPGNPNTVTINGDSSAATGPECAGLRNAWWEAFQLDKCADVVIDFCGSDPVTRPSYVMLATSCSPDGSTCGDFLSWNDGGRGLCPSPEDENITIVFDALAPGTYYYPIIADGQGSNVPGPYVMHISAEECTGVCSGCLGACCDTSTESCNDDVAETSCSGTQQIWSARTQCCEVECRDPAGPEFDALDVNLLSRVTIEDLAGFNGTPGDPHTGNEMWGYTSPLGRRYALVGTTTGTGIVEVTDPRNPVIVAFVMGGGFDEVWRDMATYQDYLYVVNDSSTAGNGMGLQIVELSDIDNGTSTLVGSAVGGMKISHNVFVNPDSARAYACGAGPFGTGFVVFDLADPRDPQPIGVWENVYVHDLQAVSYDACPSDPPHIRSGAPCEIVFAFAGTTGMKILDVTDPSAILTLSSLTYPTLAYCHQGWLSEDRHYVFFNDELDESWGEVSNTRTYVVDVQNLSSPTLVHTFDHAGCWIDHNLMVRGDRVYQAHYAAGLRVLDAADPLSLSEVAYFDTRPEDNVQDFPGAWGVFTDYPTRIVTVSDRQRGLFVLCDEPGKPIPGFVSDQNPATQNAPVGFDAASSTTCDPSRWLVSYEWDFDYDEVTFDVQATGPTPAHTYTSPGDYAVALRVTDNQGARAISSLTITVQEGIPTLSEWGLVVTALLLLTTGTVTIRAKRSAGQDLGR